MKSYCTIEWNIHTSRKHQPVNKILHLIKYFRKYDLLQKIKHDDNHICINI